MCLASTSLELGTVLLTSVTTAFLSLVVEIGLFFTTYGDLCLRLDCRVAVEVFNPRAIEVNGIRYLEDEVGQSPFRWLYYSTKGQSSDDKPIIARPLKSVYCFVPCNLKVPLKIVLGRIFTK